MFHAANDNHRPTNKCSPEFNKLMGNLKSQNKNNTGEKFVTEGGKSDIYCLCLISKKKYRKKSKTVCATVNLLFFLLNDANNNI